jgi:hypothetical protein
MERCRHAPVIGTVIDSPVLIISPLTIWKYQRQGTINEVGASRAFHTLSNGPDGCVRICFTQSWDPDMSYVSILHRGALWLEALEAHQATSLPISDFLGHE